MLKIVSASFCLKVPNISFSQSELKEALFNLLTKENVKKFIESNKDNLNIYIDNYNRLLGNSKLFRTVAGHTFGTYHVTQLQQYVSDGSFFGVNHKIVLQDDTELNTLTKLFFGILRS